MIRSHYVPQVYLRGFSSSKEQIFFYEKGKGGAKNPTSLKNIAQEKGFYSAHTEQALSVVESLAAPVLDKIRNQQSITPDDKIIIATFMAIMWRRVPAGWERLKNIAHNPEPLFKDIESNWSHPEFEQFRLRMRQIVDDWQNDFPKHLWDWGLVNYLPLLTIHVLSKMTWRFYVSDKPAFLTSDNPVALYSIGTRNGIVRFPISSFIALEATAINWRGFPDLEFCSAHESEILGINLWIVAGATRYIYHSGNVEWVLQRLDI